MGNSLNKNNKRGNTTQTLHISLLGAMEVRVAGEKLNIGYTKLHGLLAILAMSAGTPLQRDYLAELLWPDKSGAARRQNLRRALYNLKAALGETGHLLCATPQTVTLDSQALWLDVKEFSIDEISGEASTLAEHSSLPYIAQLKETTNLYRGEFMTGFSLPECPDFGEWLLLQRDSQHRRLLSLLEQLSNHYEKAADYGQALPFALRHAELEPLSENAQCQLMRLYALNGQDSAALHQYDATCSLLQTELGVIAGDETRHLARQIRNGKLSGSINSGAIDGLISELYRSIDQPDQWEDVFGKIANSLGADRFFFASRDTITLEMQGQFHWSMGDDALNDYMSHYSSVDELSKNLEGAQRNRFHTSQDIYPDRELFSSEIYNDFCRPYGIRHSAGVAFDDPASTLYSQFTCLRGADMDEFNEKDLRPWNTLIPHLQQFVSLRNKFQSLETLSRSTDHVVEHFPVAAFLCKANGQILGRNSLAEELLRTAVSFTSRAETLLFYPHHQQTKFSELLHQAHNAVNGINGFSNSSFHIQDNDSNYELTVMPFTYRPEGVVDCIEPCALVLVADKASTNTLIQ